MLRDHFHSPLDDLASWQEFHAQWPAMLVRTLVSTLPLRYVAAPSVQHGSFVEIDVAAMEQDEPGLGSSSAVADPGWTPEAPTQSLDTDLPTTDEHEVLVYDAIRRRRRLVAAIEIVSPANKDRPDHRNAFLAKCVSLLQKRVAVTIVDIVSSRRANLFASLMEMLGQPATSATAKAPLYAVALRCAEKADQWRLETWEHSLAMGQSLPTLPLWLARDLAVPLPLEESYEETCRVLRIPMMLETLRKAQ